VVVIGLLQDVAGRPAPLAGPIDVNAKPGGCLRRTRGVRHDLSINGLRRAHREMRVEAAYQCLGIKRASFCNLRESRT